MSLQEMPPVEAARMLEEHSDTTVLLDVREPQELLSASVDGALHIPMAEIPGRLDEIDPDKTVICMCHLGGRSAYVGEFLLSQGYTRVINLTGGIDAWARDIGER